MGKKGDSQSALSLEYGEINTNFRHLAEIRFKLLALVPLLGGAAVFALSVAGFSAAGATPSRHTEALWLVAAVAILGFLASLGIVAYDQRNSEIYNGLLHPAKFLEESLRSPISPGSLRPNAASGGQFQERPEPARTLVSVRLRHDTGLALIYGPILGAWFFPALFAALRIGYQSVELSVAVAAAVSTFAGALLTRRLIALDEEDRKRWTAAWVRDHPPAYPKVVQVGVISDYRLSVRFSDGTTGELDAEDWVNGADADDWVALRDPAVFAQARIDNGVVTWLDSLELAPDVLYREIKANRVWKP